MGLLSLTDSEIMISKEVQQVANMLPDFYANEVTIGIFASSLCWAMREMNMYCFDQEMKRDYEKSN